MNKRIICLDVGDARIGVAVSDPSGTIATPVEVIQRKGWGPDCRRIRQLCDQYETDEVLSGLPLNMDGTEGFQARKVREFCSQVEKQGLKVYFQDERLTTVLAEDALLEDGMSRERRKQNVDKVAAAVILQQWLEERKKTIKFPACPARTGCQILYNRCIYRTKKEEKKMSENWNPEDEELDVIELVDEEGKTETFELLAAFDLDNAHYLALTDPEEDEDSEEMSVFILKTETDEEGNDTYVSIDEEESDKAFAYLLSLMEEEGEED